ncbi:M48 family metalloprotease [Aquabacterium sp.]|uniref:M48 family metalloprotease n=1 Tax=Aquabacterium sp. TaxID=1872578 RepID=UPI002B6B194A|nr:M48 family metalloprotease [Aquabacterium sp.]HSW03886.1 M48 family metalloprotease [Aquabacterium sp.]
MRWLFVFFLALTGVPAWCEGIVEVLARSQQQRLEASPEADPQAPASRTIRRTFDTLLRRAGPLPPVELRVVSGAALAETLHGRVIVVNQSLADLTEGERLFILAHELGHVMLGHWPQMTGVYQAWVPGEVLRPQTDAVAPQLGREASAMAHRHELEADTFGLRALRELGHSPRDAVSAFMAMGVRSDSATHPGTRKRLASLRAAEAALTGAE